MGTELAECSNWSAWHGSRLPAPPVLTVAGECEFPTAGYSVELRRYEPQGINPRDLLLDLVVHEPTGPVAQIITTVEARYEEETDFEYESVTILPDGPSIPVEKVGSAALQSMDPEEFERQAREITLAEDEYDDIRATAINALTLFGDQEALDQDAELVGRVEQLREEAPSEEVKRSADRFLRKQRRRRERRDRSDGPPGV